MPRHPGEYYYSDEQFSAMIEKLNALNHPTFPWRRTQARKEHEDLFGETIRNGETYFKREIGAAWGSVIKLSHLSMERLLHALFSANWGLEEVGEEIAEQRREEMREAHRRFSPVQALFKNSLPYKTSVLYSDIAKNASCLYRKANPCPRIVQQLT